MYAMLVLSSLGWARDFDSIDYADHRTGAQAKGPVVPGVQEAPSANTDASLAWTLNSSGESSLSATAARYLPLVKSDADCDASELDIGVSSGISSSPDNNAEVAAFFGRSFHLNKTSCGDATSLLTLAAGPIIDYGSGAGASGTLDGVVELDVGRFYFVEDVSVGSPIPTFGAFWESDSKVKVRITESGTNFKAALAGTTIVTPDGSGGVAFAEKFSVQLKSGKTSLNASAKLALAEDTPFTSFGATLVRSF